MPWEQKRTLKDHATIGIPSFVVLGLLAWAAHLAWDTYCKVEAHDFWLKYHGLDKPAADAAP